jgi:hypothetical protein
MTTLWTLMWTEKSPDCVAHVGSNRGDAVWGSIQAIGSVRIHLESPLLQSGMKKEGV